jgi:hypothetical protein
MTMIHTPVSSETIFRVGYEFETKTLEIVFTTGLIYAYFEVPEKIVYQLLKSKSKGEFFNHHIRNSFEYQKVLPYAQPHDRSK